ncbi:hypothetical protein CYMTET_29560 [Cymbomonas tetramitiformis]|uniref:Thiol-disulfide oxidoreductase DCC n=1 Tax=Cymbomonas tetramitiformis TaxID=36881 RepID=A0AAE0FKZ9_9CHLO|nr:hypothetical protein CYMTET_29560 [Cymbomonas tetramitiformis]
MLYDGDCPLCMREVNMLKDRNKAYGTIDFVDIAGDDYRPEDNQGIDFETGMAKIHAITKEGKILTGVPVFRQLYEAVGLGWVYGFLDIPGAATVAEKVYDFWAEYRLPVTGRPPLPVVLEARRQRTGEAESCSVDGRCD